MVKYKTGEFARELHVITGDTLTVELSDPAWSKPESHTEVFTQSMRISHWLIAKFSYGVAIFVGGPELVAGFVADHPNAMRSDVVL